MDDLAIPRKRSQGDYWRGDLLRTMLFFETSQRDFVSFALRRGYDFEPHLPIEEPPILPPSVVPVEERVDEKITDSPSVIQPVSERFWVPVRYLVDRFAPETDLGIHGLDKTQSKEGAVIGDAQIQQPQVKYLAAWPELRNRLDPLLGFPKRTRRLDTEVLIKRISRGDPIRQIPFYQRKRTHDQITVIKEHALHCAPYRLDQEMVVEHLSKATARGGLQVLDAFFPYSLTNPESGDSTTVIRRQEVEPTPGSHILILGDLGLLLKIKDPFDRDAVEWWYGCLPDAKRSDRTRFVELPASVESRKVQIECKPSGIGLRGVGKSASDSMLVGSSNRVTMASGRPVLEISVPEGLMDPPIKAFWKSGSKPDWVSAFGKDDYGLWCEFQLPRHDGKGVVTQRMRWIKSGKFMMGSPEEEIGRWVDESPQHEVELTKGFWLGDTPCTQELWMATTKGKNPSKFSGDRKPVERVSWKDCQGWLKGLGEFHPLLQPALPTEAQWEYACRAGSTGSYCFGDEEHELEKYAWYDKDRDRQTHPVAEKLPNVWGLYDVHGNVWEWCSDWFGQYADSTRSDLTGPAKGTTRVMRGGSWFYPARLLRSACRSGNDPGIRDINLGFRLLSSARPPK